MCACLHTGIDFYYAHKTYACTQAEYVNLLPIGTHVNAHTQARLRKTKQERDALRLQREKLRAEALALREAEKLRREEEKLKREIEKK